MGNKMKIFTAVGFIFIMVQLSFAQGRSEPKKLKQVPRMDTTAMRNYLTDPRNNYGFDKTQTKSECVTKDSIEPGVVVKREIRTCTYSKDDSVLYYITFTVFQTDSTWAFDTNGWQLLTFDCDNKKMSLKYGLQVGSTIQDFQKYFGKFSCDKGNKFFHETTIDNRRVTLMLITENSIVTRIKIITA